MSLPTAFQASFFVTLGLASACLALAESFFLWWMGYFLLGTVALLALAYRCEGRWSLSADAANRLGLVIAIGTGFWIVCNLPRTEEDLLAADIPWPAGLLPHLGPLLVLLLLVKLFRPKRVADYWVIQIIGLMMVTLGCVLAAEPFFGVLMVAYLAALLWSAALFYLVREQARAGCAASGDASAGTRLRDLPLFNALPDTPAQPCSPIRPGQVATWTSMVVASGLLMFLVAPRQDNLQWEPKQLTRAAKGIVKSAGVDGGMDCSRIGKIELSDEPAFEVEARDVRGPKLDLDPETRWPMQTLDYYFQGHWTSWEQGAVPQHLTWGMSPKSDPLALPSVEGRSHPRFPPADLADPDYYLYFKVRLASAGGLVLAEPLQGTRLGLYPHLGEEPREASLFFHLVGTDSILARHQGRRRLYQYGQVLHKPANAHAVPAKEINPRYRQYLLSQEVPEAITQWVRELIRQLPDLSAADRRLDARGYVPAAAQARVAHALTRYLAFSGEFGYSLYLERRQMNLDPLADFLLNVKEGHCERYAGGLTLMLRALGIPARVTKGYRGLDPLEEGRYVVRQNHGHSWVQALIRDGNGEQWLILDPTPGSERANKPLLSWFAWLFQGWGENDLWRNYILEYNADHQGHAVAAIRNQLSSSDPWALGTLLLLPPAGLGMTYAAFKLRRRAARRRVQDKRSTRPTSGGTGFYRRFLELAERLLNIRPEPGQTPREFALEAQASLEGRELRGECAAIPLNLVDLLYRATFSGRGLSEAEERQAAEKVQTLEAKITGLKNEERRTEN
jgi:transglutaminase-like putative cysteine protease